MKGRNRIQCIILICFLPFMTLLLPHNSHAQLIDIGPLDEGLQLTREGKLSEAGDFWVTKGDEYSENSTRVKKLNQAAIAYVLASKAFEMANNAKAYQCWGKATQRFMESSTSWGVEQGRIRNFIQKLQADVQGGLSQETGGVSLNEEEQLWMAFHEELQLLSFDGPQLGLSDETDVSPTPTLPSSGRNYHGRPLFIAEDERRISPIPTIPSHSLDPSTSRIRRGFQQE